MSIHTSSALLLRKIRFRNTSYIIDVLTENRGRTTLIAKGARREKSGFFGCLDFCSLLEIVFIDKPDAMGMLTSCDVASYFAGIHRSRRRLACSMLFVRMVREFVQDRETDTGLFRVCSSFFSDIHFCDESGIFETYISYLLVLLELSGFRPECSRCSVCGASLGISKTIMFDREGGEMFCRECRYEKKDKKYLELSSKTCIIIDTLQTGKHTDSISFSHRDMLSAERFLLEFSSSVLNKDLRSVSIRLYDAE